MGLEYRIIKRDTADGHCWHEIRMVEADADGRVVAMIEDEPSRPGGEFLVDLLADLQLMVESAKDQILELRGAFNMI